MSRALTILDLTQAEIEAGITVLRAILVQSRANTSVHLTGAILSLHRREAATVRVLCTISCCGAALWIVAVIVFFVQPLAGVVLFVIAFFPLVGGGVGLVVVQARISRENFVAALRACGAVKKEADKLKEAQQWRVVDFPATRTAGLATRRNSAENSSHAQPRDHMLKAPSPMFIPPTAGLAAGSVLTQALGSTGRPPSGDPQAAQRAARSIRNPKYSLRGGRPAPPRPARSLPRLAAAGVAVAVLKFWGRGEQAYRFSRSDSRSESSGGSGGGDRNRVSGEALPSTLVVPPP